MSPRTPTRETGSLVARDDRTTVALAFGGSGEATSMTLAARVRSAAPAGLSVSATSYNDLQNGSKSAGFGVLAETVFGGIGALVILGLVFGSLLALVPLVVAIVSILTTFVLIGVVTDLTTVSVLVEYLIALIGLGIAIYYSLLVVTRWREERGRGRSNEELSWPQSRPWGGRSHLVASRSGSGCSLSSCSLCRFSAVLATQASSSRS